MKHFTLPKDGGLIEKYIPAGILHSYEKIPVEISPESRVASEKVANQIVEAINAHEEEGPFRLGLSTGRTPTSLYNILAEKCAKKEVSFKNVEIYSIDEYYSATDKEAQRRNLILKDLLLSKIDIKEENIHLPNGFVPEEKITKYCQEFDKEFRGLNLLVIGIGENAQIGFNDSCTPEQSRTRTVLLNYTARKKHANDFGGDVAKTPQAAITVGIDTVMSAKKIILMAWGEEKAQAVINVCEKAINPECPASYLQKHGDVTMFVDENASGLLTRVVSPWLVGSCEWTSKFIRKAVVWLCQKVNKPILKLVLSDYLENSLDELVDKFGPYDKINIDVFNDLQQTITGWPGGKPNADDSTRPVEANPYPKTVLILSPHPDDDVISMGGTFIRLTSQGHNVHVAYQTSGNVAVHDDVVLQHMDAARELGFGDRYDEVKALIDSKVPGEPEPRELLNIKGSIRRSEAKAADRSFGLNDETNVHFLNLPFYESGGIQKLPRTQADLDIIKDLIKELKPHQIFMAGDLADPHGTHRVCTEAALEAIEQLQEEGNEWINSTHIWLYRGAWMEWELGKVDMAVPLSPDELVEKRHSIFRHLSQKDIVPFPGDDPREFWQRAEDRTKNTARLYDELGMAEYQAIEVFVKLR